MYRFLLLSLLFLLSCDRKETKPAPTPDITADLSAKRSLYLELVRNVQDRSGFIETEACDSLLWSGLAGASGIEIDLLAARSDYGKWFRRPLTYPECYAEHLSASTISRDMLLGVMWHYSANGDMQPMKSLWHYAKSHKFKMGDGAASRIYLTPNMQWVLARMAGDSGFETLPEMWSKTTDYEAHVQVLLILLRGRTMGAITGETLKVLQKHATREPENALFQFAAHYYTDGDQTEATAQLMRTDYFPADRLPTNADRCNGWLWERDYGANWKPCGGDKIQHSGGDLLFIAWLLDAAAHDNAVGSRKTRHAFGVVLN